MPVLRVCAQIRAALHVADSDDRRVATPVILLTVLSCLPFLMRQVRIFVELEKVEAATKAIVGLHGRYFDQKTISATFFDEQRFEAMDLAPRPEELRQ
jgi:hypothetical protein